jgi:hypothetical protein
MRAGYNARKTQDDSFLVTIEINHPCTGNVDATIVAWEQMMYNFDVKTSIRHHQYYCLPLKANH